MAIRDPIVDVAIIGAGLAGLSAAQLIIQAGYTCTILEARNRVGGRTWSRKFKEGDEDEDGIVDVGAAWINDTNQSRMIAIAKAAGVDLIVQNIEGQVVFQDSDKSLGCFAYGGLPPFSEAVKSHIATIRDKVESDCQSLNVNITNDTKSTELDSMTFRTYLEKNLNAKPEAIQTATIWTRAMLGQEPHDISALWFLHYCKAGGGLMQMRSDGKGGGQYLRVRQGTQSFSRYLASTLPEDTIRFESAVDGIRQVGPEHVAVSYTSNNNDGETETRTIQARKVICAIPPGAITSNIKFTPALPESKSRLLQSFKYNYYQKVLVHFRSPFWIRLGYCGLMQSFVGPACVVRDTSCPALSSPHFNNDRNGINANDDSKNSLNSSSRKGDDSTAKYELTCFVAGSIGLEWSKLPTVEQRNEAILTQLEDLFGEHRNLVRQELLGMYGWQWNDERWNGFGCPCGSLGPGVLSSFGGSTNYVGGSDGDAGSNGDDSSKSGSAAQILQSNVGDIHFAGTETSSVWRGYMEGAVRSGEREGRKVVDLLDSEDRKKKREEEK